MAVIKAINTKDLDDEESWKDALQEAKILEVCSHPNIPKFIEVYQTLKSKVRYINIVMEYADDGDLSNKIKLRKHTQQFWTEDEIFFNFT